VNSSHYCSMNYYYYYYYYYVRMNYDLRIYYSLEYETSIKNREVTWLPRCDQLTIVFPVHMSLMQTELFSLIFA